MAQRRAGAVLGAALLALAGAACRERGAEPADGAVDASDGGTDAGGGDGGDAGPAPCPAQRIFVGTGHACALLADGNVRCWGSNDYGQLGDGTTADRAAPVRLGGLPGPAADIALGAKHTCVLGTDGLVRCLGRGIDGQLGQGSYNESPTPKPVTTLPAGITAITSGEYHSCALGADGAVWCWGDGSAGQIGVGGRMIQTLPVVVAGFGGTSVGDAAATSIDAGGYHTCAVRADGIGWCWGFNGWGTLGDGASETRDRPVQVQGLDQIARISAGGLATCAVRTNGSLWCWGDGRRGLLGDGHGGFALLPVPVKVGALGAKAVDFSVGAEHVCVVRVDGSLWCWGAGRSGQLGDGVGDNRLVPMPVPELGGPVASVAAGGETTLALRRDGHIMAFGRGSNGQLGDGGAAVPRAVALPLDKPVRAMAAGESSTCAIDEDGAVACFGSSRAGLLADGATGDHATPTPVPILGAGQAGLALSDAHACHWDREGTAYCWGDNMYGQLGDGSKFYREQPVPVDFLGGITAKISLGFRHSCVLSKTGGVACWGINLQGQLGDGTSTEQRKPRGVPGLVEGALSMDVGSLHSCAVRADGTILCWGENANGQLGTGDVARSHVPKSVLGLQGPAVEVSAGHEFTCARLGDGRVQCWGDGSVGQMGHGETRARLQAGDPIAIGGPAVALAAGRQHVCAVRADGGVACWGDGRYGQLGDGNTAVRTRPVDALGVTGAVQLAAGGRQTCIVNGSGQAWCWGWNGDGQIGDGRGGHAVRPRAVASCR